MISSSNGFAYAQQVLKNVSNNYNQIYMLQLFSFNNYTHIYIRIIYIKHILFIY